MPGACFQVSGNLTHETVKFMHLSHYSIIIKNAENPDSIILYSIKKESLIRINQDTLEMIQTGDLPEEAEKQLTDLEFLVPDQVYEKKEMLGYIEDFNQNFRELDITVTLNLDCNFACIYCCEEEIKHHKLYMNSETQEDTLGFVEKNLDGKTKLKFDFFGGEPLLSMDMIRFFAKHLKTICNEKGIDLEFGMTTNGSLLTRNRAKELKELGVTNLKITVDGPAEIHNRYRPFKNGTPSFEAIIKNIKDSWDILNIELSGNYDENTWREFPKLLDQLMEEGITPEKISKVTFGPISKNSVHEKRASGYQGGISSLSVEWIIEAGLILRGEVLKRGFHVPKPSMFTCMMEMKNLLLINFDGFIYKCPTLLGLEEFKAGHVKTGLLDYSRSHAIGFYKNHSECHECKYLPMCFGGCRAVSWGINGRLDVLDCRKEYLDKTVGPRILQDIEYRELIRNREQQS